MNALMHQTTDNQSFSPQKVQQLSHSKLLARKHAWNIDLSQQQPQQLQEKAKAVVAKTKTPEN